MNTDTITKTGFTLITIGAALVAVAALVLAIIGLARTPAGADAAAQAEDEAVSWDCSAEIVRIAPVEEADQDLERRMEIVATAVEQALGDAPVTVEVMDELPEPEVLRDRDTPSGVNLLVDAGPRDQGYVIERDDYFSTRVSVTEIVDRTLLAGALRPELPACAQTEEG